MIISIGESRKAQNWKPREINWEGLVANMRQPRRTSETMAQYAAMSKPEKAEAKDVGGYVAGELQNGSRNINAVQKRWLIALDADFASTDIIDTFDMMLGCRALVHSTHSHTPDHPRLRFLIPLTRPVSAEEYEPVARRIAESVGIEDFDDTTYQSNRLMYWPSCPADGEYIFKVFEGPTINPSDVLATYEDWRDMRSWPVSSRQKQLVKHLGDKQGNPLEKPGIIGAFNRAHTITSAIETYLPDVYSPAGAHRWTYNGGTTLGGAVTFDNDTFLYSYHDTDPVSCRLCNAFDLVRLHLYGSRDSGSEDTLSDSPSQMAMKELCADDPAVREQLADAIREPSEVFDNLNGPATLEVFKGDYTQQGAANKFSNEVRGCLRYNGGFGWMYWDGTRWILGAEAEAKVLIMHFFDKLYGEAKVAKQTAGEDKYAKASAEALMNQATRLRSSSGLNALATYAKAILNDPETDSYDANPWDLNTPDGIIDLKTGQLRPHDPCAKCTKITAASVAAGTPDAQQMWSEFIDHITAGDKAFATYLQQLAGMAAVGAVFEEGLVISYGPGGNGKSTFWGALRSVLGDYARGINADVLVAQANGHTDQSYVAALRGARLALMGETEEGAKFGVAQMKRLTSRDTISARALYKDPIEFKPSHTTIMHTNHLPKLKSLDGGVRRRVAVAPFPATLPPERIITNFEDLLVQRCAGVILKWIVDGARMFWAAECQLHKPPCVLRATAEYMVDEDWLGRFLDECCERNPNKVVAVSALYTAYKNWAVYQGEYVRSRTDLGKAMDGQGFAKERVGSPKQQRVWMGLALRDEEPEGANF